MKNVPPPIPKSTVGLYRMKYESQLDAAYREALANQKPHTYNRPTSNATGTAAFGLHAAPSTGPAETKSAPATSGPTKAPAA